MINECFFPFQSQSDHPHRTVICCDGLCGGIVVFSRPGSLQVAQLDILCVGVNICVAFRFMCRFAAATWINATLDSIDGKQARRTASASPLGEILDHSMDSINLVLMAPITMLIFGFQPGWQTAILSVFGNINAIVLMTL